MCTNTEDQAGRYLEIKCIESLVWSLVGITLMGFLLIYVVYKLGWLSKYVGYMP